MAEIVKHKNPIINRFVRENITFTSDEFLKFQDPTMLGFKLMFNFNDRFGLLDSSGSINSALGYLKRIGDNTRSIYMEEFIDLLRQINQKAPWYFQTIEGLPDLWNRNLMEVYKEDRQITIGCLESLDLRITGMIDLYRKACFDWKNRREVVPENLRRFDLMIYVYDWRIFNDFENIIGNIGAQKRSEQAQLFGKDLMNFEEGDDLNIGRTASRFLFKLRKCEFLANESNSHLEAVSNTEGSVIAQKLVINYFDFEEENVYTQYLNGKVSDNLLQALDNAALDVQPPIFANPITGNNQAGFYPNTQNFNSIENNTFLENISNEAQEALLSNLLEVLPPGERIFDVQNLINSAGQQLSDLLGSAIGQALLANTDLFEDSPSLENTNSTNIGEINDDEAQNLTISVDDNIEINDFDLITSVDSQIENNVQNLVSTVEENLQGALNPQVDSFDFELNGGSLSNGNITVNDLIESSDFGLSQQISEAILGEAQIFFSDLSGDFEEAQQPQVSLNGSFGEAQNIPNSLEGNLLGASVILEEISEGIIIGESEQNTSSIVSDIISGEALVNSDSLEGDFKEVDTGLTDLNGIFEEAKIPLDDIESILEPVIPTPDEIENFIIPAKIEIIDLSFEAVPASVLDVDLQNELIKARIVEESGQLELKGAPELLINLDSDQKEAEQFTENLQGNFKSTQIIKGELGIIGGGGSIENKTRELTENDNLISITGLSIELAEGDKITGNAKVIEDKINGMNFEKALVKSDGLDGGLKKAVNKEEPLEETQLDPYNPNFIDPEKDC